MTADRTIALGCDHAGVSFRPMILKTAEAAGWKVLDMGTFDTASVDYPDYAQLVCQAIPDKASFGLLVCGTGIGMSMAANRHRHIRAALCHNATTARLTREHNNANVVVLGARVIGEEVAKECLEVFLRTAFQEGRHQKRLDKFC
jgi:ribose 5-phosphate isomerase B